MTVVKMTLHAVNDYRVNLAKRNCFWKRTSVKEYVEEGRLFRLIILLQPILLQDYRYQQLTYRPTCLFVMFTVQLKQQRLLY